jgi:hypothetical protein
MAGLAAYLASDETAFLTAASAIDGEHMSIDGVSSGQAPTPPACVPAPSGLAE